MTLVRQVLYRSRNIVLYAAVMAAMVFILKWLQWKYLITDNSSEIYVALIAILFTALGIWLAKRLVKSTTETIIVEREVYLTPAETPISDIFKRLSLSEREAEVLKGIIQGRSNAEIADDLFLSVSTVKTHVSNLFAKMGVKSRTQAIQKASQLRNMK